MRIAVDRWAPRLLGLATGLMVSGVEADLGVKIRPFDLAVLLAAALTFLTLRQGKSTPAGLASVVTAMCLYGLYLTGNGALLSRMSDAVKEGLQYGFFILFFLTFVVAIRGDAPTQRFARWALGSLVLVGLWNAAWHLSQGILSGWKGLDEPKLAHSLVVVFIAAIVAGRGQRLRIWAPVLCAALVLMILSGERKGWIAATAAILVLQLLANAHLLRPTRLMMHSLFAAAGISLLVAAAPSVPYIQKQIDSSRSFVQLALSGRDLTKISAEETTISNRARLFGLALARGFYSEAPVFGIGLENYDRRVRAMDLPDVFEKGAHNEVLRIAAELGSVGLALYALLYVVIGRRAAVLVWHRGLLDPLAQFRLRLGIALFAYGAVANVFLGGGGVNLFLVFLPAALIFSVPTPVGDGVRRNAHPRSPTAGPPNPARQGPPLPVSASLPANATPPH